MSSRRRRSLILPKLLADESQKGQYQGRAQDDAHQIILKWADLESKGHLFQRKETALDAEFLADVFCGALGYRAQTDNPEGWTLERQFSIQGVGTADGAIGNFRPGSKVSPIAVIEFKGPNTDLDRDRFNGRTPVQQCWDYLNALPDCPWGIVSNIITLRLYRQGKSSLAFEAFNLQELRDFRRFREFYCLFEVGGLLKPVLGKVPRAQRLLDESGERQREVGDELYAKYSENRLGLISHLHRRHKKPLDRAVAIAQKLLDRIIFVAFCEDRALLPPKIIEETYRNVPPLPKVTNPRWQNFLDLFHAVDTGHENLNLDRGYNGGLFKRDPEVDDLQLDDEWTGFFKEIGGYDFRDEVNVDVLGHLFEKSVTELEKLRQGGLFDCTGDAPASSHMPKSAKRKRFGIYYTPPEFTEFIVRNTVEAVIRERLDKLAQACGVDPNADAEAQDAAKLSAYWHESFKALRNIKIMDPACGSGAFLIQAYDVLEEHYQSILSGIGVSDRAEAEALEETLPDIILAENLFGADVSFEAVEITQLALWIRSACPGRTLADLSKNIVAGNSLVDDAKVHPNPIVWEEAFPAVFKRPQRGFDCVIGNPPWERLKLQEREFFSFSAPNIAGAVSAAKRRRLIAALEAENPELCRRYVEAKENAERTLSHVRKSGRFPLTAKGDINTYMLFAELAYTLAAPGGRVGLLTPSGIATDNTTRKFFQKLTDSKRLLSLHDYENKAPVFPDVHRSFKFCTIVFGGKGVRCDRADYLFFARTMRDAVDRSRHIRLSAADIKLLNPNTQTCPIFRTNRDAELTKAIYRRVPVLVDESRGERGNPWGIRFMRMFDQTNDAELFHSPEALRKQGFCLRGNRWVKGKQVFLPLYEAKMVQAYDHRAASVVIDTENWVRQGQTETTTLVRHQNTDYVAQPRWWVAEAEVSKALGGGTPPGFLCFKDVTSPTNERTMIAAIIPRVGVLNSAPLVFTAESIVPRLTCCLLANLDSLVLDFVARQKVGGVHLNFFIVEQLPLYPPDAYAGKAPWTGRQTLERWISDRVLKLTCAAEDMRPFGEACGMRNPVHKWNPEERARLKAELDAAYFHLYGVSREDAEYILSTFKGTRRRDEAETGGYRTADLVLAAYDALTG